MAALAWAFTAKNADNLVTAIIADTDKYLDRLHIAAVSCVMARMVYNNTDPMKRLFVALRDKRQYVVGLKKWFEAEGHVKIGLDDNKNLQVKCVQVENITEEAALEWAKEASKFWEANTPPDPFKGFNFQEELAKLLKRAEDMERAKREGTLKRKGEIVELSDDDKSKINLDGYRKIFNKIHTPTSEVQTDRSIDTIIDSVH